MYTLVLARHFPTQPGSGEYLAGVAHPGGIEGAAQSLHGVQVLSGEHPRHVSSLVRADAVLAGDRATVFDAQVEDRPRDLLGGLRLARFSLVEQNQRVQVAIPGVEDVGYPDSGTGP